MLWPEGDPRRALRAAALLAAVSLLSPVQAQPVDKYAAVREKLATCVPCHGENGASTQPMYPILAGQHLHYLYLQLKDMKSGLRANQAMAPIVKDLKKDEMLAIAEYFSKQSWPRFGARVDDAQKASALSSVNAGQCVGCHLSGFEGNSSVPRLAGQRAEYLAKTMLDFKTKARSNSPDKSSLMASFSEQQLRDLAAYLASLTVHGRARGSEVH